MEERKSGHREPRAWQRSTELQAHGRVTPRRRAPVRLCGERLGASQLTVECVNDIPACAAQTGSSLVSPMASRESLIYIRSALLP